MKNYIVLCVILCFLSQARGWCTDSREVKAMPAFPPTVDSIDVSAYLGRWYQMYASLIPNRTYEKDGYCVIADYFPLPLKNVAFGLNNSETQKSPSGELSIASGVAFETGDPGKYEITIGTGSSSNTGSYWIVALGAIPRGKKLYPWSIVSVPYETTLFILARNATEFRQKYEETVLKLAEDLGFKFFFNKPIETYQEDDCKYLTPEYQPNVPCHFNHFH